MRATIEHESRGRMRLRLRQKNMTLRQADLLETWLKGQPWTREAVVHERTCCVILTYGGDRETVLSAIGQLHLGWSGGNGHPAQPQHEGPEPGISRETGGQGADERGFHAVFSYPSAHRPVVWHMIPFLSKGLRCLGRRRIKVELLDALSIGISVFRRTSALRAPSCSCWKSGSCWRTGHEEVPWPTWRRACPSMWIGCG